MSQEPLEATQPIELHEADTAEDFTTDIWADPTGVDSPAVDHIGEPAGTGE